MSLICSYCGMSFEPDRAGAYWLSDPEFEHFICRDCISRHEDASADTDENDFNFEIYACRECDGNYIIPQDSTSERYTCAGCIFQKGASDAFKASRDVIPHIDATCLPCMDCNFDVVDVPLFMTGELAEWLVELHIQETGLKTINVSNVNGIDLLFVTTSMTEYKAFYECVFGEEFKPSPYTQLDYQRSIVHSIEIKCNTASMSKAQQEKNSFFETRIKRALKGELGEAAQIGAKKVGNFMDNGCDYEHHLIKVYIPMEGSQEYDKNAPIVMSRQNWATGRHHIKQKKVLLQDNCRDFNYMNSNWIGDTGETIVRQFLECRGYEVFGPVTNTGGIGVDLVAKVPRSVDQWHVFEIKTGCDGWGPALSTDEKAQWQFVMDRVGKVADQRQPYANSTEQSKKLATLMCNQLLTIQDWQDKVLYFKVMVKLPAQGTSGQPHVKVCNWEPTKHLKNPFLYSRDRLVQMDLEEIDPVFPTLEFQSDGNVSSGESDEVEILDSSLDDEPSNNNANGLLWTNMENEEANSEEIRDLYGDLDK